MTWLTVAQTDIINELTTYAKHTINQLLFPCWIVIASRFNNGRVPLDIETIRSWWCRTDVRTKNKQAQIIKSILVLTSAYRIFYRIFKMHFQNFEHLFMHLEYLFMHKLWKKFAYNRIFLHMRSHFSAFLRILSNVNTRTRIIYAAYFRNATYMPHICSIYAAYFSAYFAKFCIFFPHILHQNCPHILRKISAINRYP